MILSFLDLSLTGYRKFKKNIFLILLLACYLQAEQPSWSVDPGDYSSSLSLVGDFYYNTESFSGVNLIGAFYGGECRGVATGSVYGVGYIYMLTIYGENSGEELTFKAWIAAEDTILNVEEGITFVPGSTIGSLATPEVFNTYLDYDFPISISDIPDQSAHLGVDFVSFNLSDYVTVQDSDDQLFSASGGYNISVNLSDDFVTLVPQDNWIGSETIVFTVTELTDNGYSSSDTATFTVLRADVPPEIANVPDQVIGSNGTFASMDLNDYINEYDTDSLSYTIELGLPTVTDVDPEWAMDPSDYEFSMSVVISVTSRKISPQGISHSISAFDSDGNNRGVAQGNAYLDGWRYLLTIYANQDGEEITFRFYDNDYQINLPIIEKVIFENNSTLGSLSLPHEMQANFIDPDISVDGIVTFAIVDSEWTGSDSLFFTITDNGTLNNYSASDDAIFSIQNNYEPVISSIPDQTIEIGSSFSDFDLDDYTETLDGDEIYYSLSENINLSPSLDGSVVSLNPISDWTGTDSIIFTVTDNNLMALSTSDTVLFTKTPFDNPPVLQGVPDQSITVGQEFESINLTSYLTELDDDAVNWSYEFLSSESETNDPVWSINSSNFTYSMNLVASVEALGVTAAGSGHRLAAIDENNQVLGVAQATSFQNNWIYNLTIYSNSLDPRISLFFYDQVSLRILPVDLKPDFISGSQIGNASSPYELHAGFMLLTISNEGELDLEINRKNWEYEENIRFTVRDSGTDNNYSYFQDVSFIIDNDSPVLTLNTQIIDEGGEFISLNLEDYVSDIGTTFDTLIVSVSTGPNFTAEIVNDNLQVFAPDDIDWHGSENITFFVTDAHPYHPIILEQEVLFTIKPVNDAPIISSISNISILEEETYFLDLELTDIDTGEVLLLSAISSSPF